MPLTAKTVVITRRSEDAAALTEALEALGAHVVAVPSLRTALLPESAWRAALGALRAASCVAFASRQGVDALAKVLTQGHATLPAGAVLWAVGPATAARAQAVWQREVLVAAPHTADGLAQGLLATLKPGCDNVVLPGALQGRTVVAELLGQAGVAVTVLPLYATTPVAGTRVGLDKPADFVLFTSPSSVTGWLLGGPHPSGARCISIGPTTSKALIDAGLPVFAQARVQSVPGLVAALLETDP